MTNTTWIYVPEKADAATPWTGRIWSEGDRSTQWSFEVIRHAELQDLYDQGVFTGAEPVTVLLDHQRPATLVRPLVHNVDPGKIGANHPFPRTRLEGSFQALLSGASVADEQEPIFSAVRFESGAFSAWYGNRQFTTEADENHRAKGITLAAPTTEVVSVAGLGTVRATRFADIRSDHDSGEVRSRTILEIDFERTLPLPEVMDLCLGIELLFGFLVGFRPRPPTFFLKKAQASTGFEAELELGGVNYQEISSPHPMRRVHRCGQDGAGLEEVLGRFSAASEDFVTRIHAVQVGRWFAASLNDAFAAVMPVFEQYVQNRFKSGDEETYIDLEKAFFEYVDQSPNPALGEFAKKHLSVKLRKSPSLPTLIDRAVTTLNAEGFRFDGGLAKRISERRATMFHSAPLMKEDDVAAFYEETQAVTAMLALLTLRDLGVSTSRLRNNRQALSDFSRFFGLIGPEAEA